MTYMGIKTNNIKVQRNIVIILGSGESKRPERLVCTNDHCGRTMMKINRDIAHLIKNNKGIHWSDVPVDVTVMEHKCRGCPNYYRIYTPQNNKALASLEAEYNV